MKNGIHKTWHPDGKKTECVYLNNLLHGEFVTHDYDGSTIREMYEHGKRIENESKNES